MNIYFLIFIILGCINILLSARHHKEIAYKDINFWKELVETLIELGLIYLAIKQGF